MTSQARLVGGRYEEGESLGRGGMAEVRKGVDNRLGRTVAIKRLRIDLASDSTFQARFRREAQSAASLNHPSIVAVYDTGEEPDPNGSGVTVPYIVMEYVAGKTLREMLREGRKIQPERSLEITGGVLEALDYSHRAGIVHRDIKPGNVMLNQYGVVKVMDFGIARAVADTSATMTQTAAVIGTAQYLSPEQARGETVDARSDLYSTGCMLYELLTGRPPFVGESPVSVAYQHVRENPVPPSSYDPDIPPEVDAVVLKALAKSREERYQSAGEMRADIHRILAGQQVTAPMAAVAETRPMYGANPALGGGTVIDDPQPEQDLVGFPPEDDDPAARARRGRGFAYFLLGLAIVALAVGGYVLWDKLSAPTAVAKIDVPNLVNKKQAEAISDLAGAQLKVGKITSKASDDFEPGTVIDQNPGPHSQVEPNTAVNITVSTGVEKVRIPDVKGETQKKATDRLTAAGFQVQVKEINSEEKQGTVVEYTPSGLAPKGTQVTLQVSDGKIQVPDVKNLTEDEATAKLRDKGFSVAALPTDSQLPPGTVTKQDPGKDAWVESGSKVTIWVSKQDEQPSSPPPSSTPTETPSSTPPPSGGVTIPPPTGGGQGPDPTETTSSGSGD